jgi:hypothetical protein
MLYAMKIAPLEDGKKATSVGPGQQLSEYK